MNWEAIGSIAEMLGALAVIGTLLYLAVQMKQNAQAISAQTYESIMSGYNQLNVLRASDAILAKRLASGMRNPDSLTADDVDQFDAMLTCYFVNYLKIYSLYQQGIIERLEFGKFATEASELFIKSPGGEAFLERNMNWKWLSEILVHYALSEEDLQAMRLETQKELARDR